MTEFEKIKKLLDIPPEDEENSPGNNAFLREQINNILAYLEATKQNTIGEALDFSFFLHASFVLTALYRRGKAFSSKDLHELILEVNKQHTVLLENIFRNQEHLTRSQQD